MPTKPKKPCRHPGCPCLTHHTHCAQHQPERQSASQRGYNHRWRKARTAYLKRHPLCRSCEEDGRMVPATVVDHVRPHRGDRTLFWDETNWQPLCKECHDRKTQVEDGIPEYTYW